MFPRSLHHRVRAVAARDDDGFTLIEVLVSMFLLVVGIFGAMTVLTQADNTQTVAQRTDVAAQAAQREMDELRSRDYRALAVQDPSTTTLGSVGGHPNLGNDPANAGLSPASKSKLQTFFDRDTTVTLQKGLSPGTDRTAPGLKIGRASGDTQSPGLSEELVDPADALQGSRATDGTVTPKAVTSYRVMNIATGAGADQRVHVFTRVSWRDVSCPVLDLSNPLGQVKELLTNLGNLLRPSANGTSNSLYDLLLGGQGAVTKLLAGRDSLLTNFLSAFAPSQPTTLVDSLLAALLGAGGPVAGALQSLGTVLQNVTSSLFGPISDLLAPIGKLLGDVVSPLASALDPVLNLVTGSLSKLTDLCDLNLVDDGSGKGLVAPLQTLLPALASANDALAGIQHNLVDQNLVGQLVDATANVTSGSQLSQVGLLPSCPVIGIVDPCQTLGAATQLLQTLTRGLTSVVTDTIGPILQTLTSVVTGLPQTLKAITTTIGSLPATLASITSNANNSILNSNKNTKRITVAVWPEDQGHLVGAHPQYFSTVVSNPKAALLTADQAG